MTNHIRIRGIVKIATTVHNILQIGINPNEQEKFKQYIQNNLKTIENICAEAGTHPEHLLSRSRKAYYFLKEIDLDHLPIILSESQTQLRRTVQPSSTLRLKNIVKQQKIILEDIFNSYNSSNPGNFDRLLHKLNSNVAAIEHICQTNQAPLTALSNSSRKIYAWMKFLTHPSWLKKHLIATQNTLKISQKISKNKLIKNEKIFISFLNMSSLYKGKTERYHHNIILNEGFITASEEIITAIIKSIFDGKTAKNTQIIKQYAVGEEYSDILLELDLSAEIEADNPQGQFLDLDLLFEKINRQYFNNGLSKPRLSWSQSLTRRKFGHYEPSRDRVVISLTLDDNNIPSFVVEFILYHELLHKHCPEKWVNGQIRIHTPEFKQLEQEFEFYQDAQAWLQKFAHFGEFI